MRAGQEANPAGSRLLAETLSYLGGRHDRAVADFLACVPECMPTRHLETRSLPCLRHLDSVALISAGGEGKLARYLSEKRNAFRWGQTYTEADFGRHFIDDYGWMELFGTRGHFVNDSMAGGFLVLGPWTHYPDHHHLAEEIYIPLTGGTGWRKGDGAFVEREAGAVIHHPSNVSHAMKTGAEPLLALYLWRGGPLAVRSTVTGKAEKA
jgi:hypothetical protein